MKNGVPSGDYNIKSINLPQDLRSKNKAQNRNFQSYRYLYPQLYLKPAWNIQKKQRQYTEEEALIIVQKNLTHHTHNYKNPQYRKYNKGTSVLLQFHIHCLSQCLHPVLSFFSFVFHIKFSPNDIFLHQPPFYKGNFPK